MNRNRSSMDLEVGEPSKASAAGATLPLSSQRSPAAHRKLRVRCIAECIRASPSVADLASRWLISRPTSPTATFSSLCGSIVFVRARTVYAQYVPACGTVLKVLGGCDQSQTRSSGVGTGAEQACPFA